MEHESNDDTNCGWYYLPTPPLGQDMTQGQFLSKLIVDGTLGIVPKSLAKRPEELEIKRSETILTTLLKSAPIHRRVLET